MRLLPVILLVMCVIGFFYSYIIGLTNEMLMSGMGMLVNMISISIDRIIDGCKK